MDFSAAQLSAFKQAYVRFNADRNPVQDPNVAAMRDKAAFEFAGKLVTGCKVHWLRSRNLVRDSHKLVPPENRQIFVRETDRLLKVSKLGEYDDVMDTLRATFPRIIKWLSWWHRPTIAATIFPALMSADMLEMRKRVAKTSNGVEANHSLLHRTVGTNLDFIPAVRGLFARSVDLFARKRAIQGRSQLHLSVLTLIVDSQMGSSNHLDIGMLCGGPVVLAQAST